MATDCLIKAAIFADSRASAAMLCAGPDTHFRGRWFPKLARQFVQNADDPAEGFVTREEATEAARKFRQSCLEFLNGETTPPRG